MRKGFTLLELIIVVIIVAILAGLGVPQFIKVVERAKASEGVSILGAYRDSQLRYYSEYQAYTDMPGSLDVTAPTSLKNFNTPDVGEANPSSATQGDNLARITNTGKTPYTLSIAANGSIYCTPATNCPTGFINN